MSSVRVCSAQRPFFYGGVRDLISDCRITEVEGKNNSNKSLVHTSTLSQGKAGAGGGDPFFLSASAAA